MTEKNQKRDKGTLPSLGFSNVPHPTSSGKKISAPFAWQGKALTCSDLSTTILAISLGLDSIEARPHQTYRKPIAGH